MNCPGCGATLRPGATFCGACGVRLAVGAPAAGGTGEVPRSHMTASRVVAIAAAAVVVVAVAFGLGRISATPHLSAPAGTAAPQGASTPLGAIPSGIQATPTSALASATPTPVPVALTTDIEASETITLPARYSTYFYVGSTAGGSSYPMTGITWSEDLAVIATYSGAEAISIGRSSSNDGSFSSFARQYGIAGVATDGYQVVTSYSAHSSVVGPGCYGCGATSAAGANLSLQFTTSTGDLVLILLGGEGTGSLILNGISASTLQNQTFDEPDNYVYSSAAIYSASLTSGTYTAQFTSTTSLDNSGTSLGAVAYILSPDTGSS